MILRNLTPDAQVVHDGPVQKEVSPRGLVQVTTETGFALLAEAPLVWASEQALVPPPPSSPTR